MALVAAGQKTGVVPEAVQPTQEDARAQLDRNERERALLAAQDNYRRVAEKIKARLRSDPIVAARPDGPVLAEIGKAGGKISGF